MNLKLSKFVTSLILISFALFSAQAEAKRFGGFRSKPSVSRSAPSPQPPKEVVVKDGTNIGRSLATGAALGVGLGVGTAAVAAVLSPSDQKKCRESVSFFEAHEEACKAITGK